MGPTPTSSTIKRDISSYHVYPYYPDFLDFPSGDERTDVDSYYAYVKSLVDFHSMPVLVSEFGLPTSRGVTHINQISGLNQGGNSELQQGEGLVSLLNDIHLAGCVGGVVFAWHDEWFKTSWNTMDFDDSAARRYLRLAVMILKKNTTSPLIPSAGKATAYSMESPLRTRRTLCWYWMARRIRAC
jgi:hypothetical protein